MTDGGTNPWSEFEVKNGLLATVTSCFRVMTKAKVKGILEKIATAEDCKAAKKAMIDEIGKDDLEKAVGPFDIERSKKDYWHSQGQKSFAYLCS